MKKLKLNAETLKVETFEGGEDALKQRGTVQAHTDFCSYDCTGDPRCTWYRDCYTERDDCTQACTGGWTCYPIGC